MNKRKKIAVPEEEEVQIDGRFYSRFFYEPYTKTPRPQSAASIMQSDESSSNILIAKPLQIEVERNEVVVVDDVEAKSIEHRIKRNADMKTIEIISVEHEILVDKSLETKSTDPIDRNSDTKSMEIESVESPILVVETLDAKLIDRIDRNADMKSVQMISVERAIVVDKSLEAKSSDLIDRDSDTKSVEIESVESPILFDKAVNHFVDVAVVTEVNPELLTNRPRDVKVSPDFTLLNDDDDGIFTDLDY